MTASVRNTNIRFWFILT